MQLSVQGVPLDVPKVRMEHYRIDETHSNAYVAWKKMGSPRNPAAEEYAQLEAAGQLGLFESPRWVQAADGSTDMAFTLPRHAVSLVRLSW